MSLALVVAVAVVFDRPACALVAVAGMAAWMIAGVKVELRGGGFRPLRTIDLLEFNACDALDAYDAEQAAIRARA